MSMLVWLTLPFYDFCGFRSVAVNSVYMQFFTFIFAVLLPGLTRLLIMSMVIHFRFFKMAAVRHLRFLNVWNTSCWSGVLFTRTYVRAYICAYVCKNFCNTQVLRFFVRAICYQFVKIVLRTCRPATMIVFYLQNAYFNGRLGVLVK